MESLDSMFVEEFDEIFANCTEVAAEEKLIPVVGIHDDAEKCNAYEADLKLIADWLEKPAYVESSNSVDTALQCEDGIETEPQYDEENFTPEELILLEMEIRLINSLLSGNVNLLGHEDWVNEIPIAIAIDEEAELRFVQEWLENPMLIEAPAAVEENATMEVASAAVQAVREQKSETSSSSDNDDDYGDQIELEFPQQEEVPTLDSETRRLTVVNMDWNHIKAVDLLVCMNSFLPKGGQILTVAVYPLEFGLKRMAEEAVRGPAIFGSDDESSEDRRKQKEFEIFVSGRVHCRSLEPMRRRRTENSISKPRNLKMAPRVAKKTASGISTPKKEKAGGAKSKQTTPRAELVPAVTVEAEELKQSPPRPNGTKAVPNADIVMEDDEDELENEKLRQYEKDRLRYYFAVIEYDCSATSSYLYKACDGVDFERTSNVLDLRFIPDDMKFDHPPRDVATEIPTNYLAPDYHTRALQHSKVNIAWDDDEPLRVKTLHRKFDPDQLNEMDFKAYLASDDEVSNGDDNRDDDDGSQENGEDGENTKKSVRENYRALLLESGDPSEGREDEDDKNMEITFNTGLEDLSKRILEKSKKNNSEETVWDAYLRKRSEKRKAKEKLAERSSEDETSNYDGEYADDGERDNQSDDFFLDEEYLKKTGLTVNSSNMKKAVKKETKLKPLSTKMKNEENAGLFTVLTLSICAGVDCSPNAARAKVLKLSCSVNRKKKVKMKFIKTLAHHWFKVVHRWKMKKTMAWRFDKENV